MNTFTQLLCLIFHSHYVIGDRNKLNYFAYGSNIFENRIHINNPSASFVDIAMLKDHRLDFNLHNDKWNGAVATIVPDLGEVVWGVLWLLDSDNIASLDRQEGVDLGWYFAKTVNVTTPSNKTVLARTYQMVHNPPKLKPHETMPLERQPSATYLMVIKKGAEAFGLPKDYIQFVSNFTSNGQVASRALRSQIGLSL